jgi:hypothetical protein
LAQRLRSATGQLVARRPDHLRRQLPGDGKNIYAATADGRPALTEAAQDPSDEPAIETTDHSVERA